MKKSDIIDYLVSENNVSRKEARKIVDSIFSTNKLQGIIVKSLLRNEKVSISGFGTFKIKRLGCRNLKIPTRKNEILSIPAGCYVSFKPSKNLRNLLKNI
jgi:nucleoid DNA-binding protein